MVSKMHCRIIITSLQAVCKVTDDNKKSTIKIKLVFANNCQLKSFFPRKSDFRGRKEEVEEFSFLGHGK